MANTAHNPHPKEWDEGELMEYLRLQMNYSIERIMKMDTAEMVDAILKDEIDKE